MRKLTPITVLETEFVSLWFHREAGIVHHQLHKHLEGEAFRSTMDAEAALFENPGATKWLSDDRENCALSREDSEWAIQIWFPRVLRAGWAQWAILLPHHVVGRTNMKRFIREYSAQGVETRVFDTPATAMAWLKDRKSVV